MAKKKIIQSAAFKRNTLTIVAITLFGLIVLSEIALAVSIPWYLQREDTMALEVIRLDLRSSFDHARDAAGALGRNEVKNAELRLIRWSLDGMADYLRLYATSLSAEELKSLHATVQNMLQTATKIRKKSISGELRLDTSFYINSLVPPETEK